ncbi:protein of unknown function [Desulfatibacillum alkenivorans DSM 16219]|jgi:hypothetical protein|uniref:DUF3786 domain-containing protein n=1 Tax=Desulfatibacillum alkenivorans DSM 16219 TaxID=1121393 RepID=A0A1M6V5I1_9BACT|nr:DUF3786 domain-containing protein [Desulfatibacillum alkenivorans]SHK76645.1 protein of unknown function [Desulfatibacillum alkenivorans DSM 16219]
MARVDDYFNAKKIAVESLSKESFEDLAASSGFQSPAENTLTVPFLNRTYKMVFPSFDFTDQDDPEKEVPIQEQVLILHYMMGDKTAQPSDDWVAYREIPGATFYFSAFCKRAIDPLKNVFEHNLEGLDKGAQILEASELDFGDAGYEFKPFPRVPVRMILYVGDDEFPSEANILFDSSAGDILSPEDLAWLAGMIVYRLMALAR